MYNVIKICKEAFLMHESLFRHFFDAIQNSIADRFTESKAWAKQVDELLRDVVYVSAHNTYDTINLDMLIRSIVEKLLTTKSNEVVSAMLKWIELVHSINNLPILNVMPDILPKLLMNLSAKPAQQAVKGNE